MRVARAVSARPPVTCSAPLPGQFDSLADSTNGQGDVATVGTVSHCGVSLAIISGAPSAPSLLEL